MAVDDPNYKIYHLYYQARYYVNSAGSVTFNSGAPITSNFNVFAGLNPTGTLRVFALLNGFNATTDATYLFDITLTTSYVTTSTIRVVHSSGSSASFQLSSIQYSLIGYNEQDAESWPFPAIRITLSTISPGSPFTSNTSLLQSYNTFWGLTSLRILSNPFISYNTTLTIGTSISLTTTNSPSSYSMTAFLFEFKECNSSTTPYYRIASDLCYDICPDREYESSVQNTCESCVHYDCLKCIANGTCTSCDATNDHRTLNAFGRCEPSIGYY